MKYYEEITLRNGKMCILRSGEPGDAEAVLANFLLTHAQTDNLPTYPEECTMTAASEAAFLQSKAESEREVEILALVDGKVVGTAGIEAIGNSVKVRHRADFGISIARDFWGLGIGTALMNACIDCARKAGFTQLELQVVEENKQGISLYEKVGFTEYGVNPRGFRTKDGHFQAVKLMLLELDKPAF